MPRFLVHLFVKNRQIVAASHLANHVIILELVVTEHMPMLYPLIFLLFLLFLTESHHLLSRWQCYFLVLARHLLRDPSRLKLHQDEWEHFPREANKCQGRISRIEQVVVKRRHFVVSPNQFILRYF